MANYVSISLLIFVLIREWQNHKIHGELINKLMSRNYHEYQVSQAVQPQVQEQAYVDQDFKPVTDPLLQQQLGSLTGLV